MLMIILYIFLGITACYWALMRLGNVVALFMIVPFFIRRMLQSAWKQRIWALPLWLLMMVPLLSCVFVAASDERGIVVGIIGAWSFFVAAIAMIICYRDGRPLKQAP